MRFTCTASCSFLSLLSRSSVVSGPCIRQFGYTIPARSCYIINMPHVLPLHCFKPCCCMERNNVDASIGAAVLLQVKLKHNCQQLIMMASAIVSTTVRGQALQVAFTGRDIHPGIGPSQWKTLSHSTCTRSARECSCLPGRCFLVHQCSWTAFLCSSCPAAMEPAAAPAAAGHHCCLLLHAW